MTTFAGEVRLVSRRLQVFRGTPTPLIFASIASNYIGFQPPFCRFLECYLELINHQSGQRSVATETVLAEFIKDGHNTRIATRMYSLLIRQDGRMSNVTCAFPILRNNRTVNTQQGSVFKSNESCNLLNCFFFF